MLGFRGVGLGLFRVHPLPLHDCCGIPPVNPKHPALAKERILTVVVGALFPPNKEIRPPLDPKT